MSLPTIVFWSCLAFVFYAYLGYPLLLAVAAKLRGRPVGKRPATPDVSLVVCAFNEAPRIRRKLENCLSLDYPRDKLEIIIASDCSSDGTDGIVREFESEGVRLIRPFAERRGKAQLVNEAVNASTGEIVVLSDARQVFDRGAVRELVANFSDPEVGAVSGELDLDVERSNPVSEGVASYWQYEKTVRRLESRVDSVIGATGAIYAIRKSLFKPVPRQTTLDDVAIPMNIVMQGYRVVFDPKAKAFDRAADTVQQEWVRKVRTLSGNYQLIFQMPSLLNPFKNRLFLMFLSHRVFSRLLVPFALVGVLVSNLFLWQGLYGLLLVAQLLFYGFGVAGLLLRSRTSGLKLLALPNAVLLLNACAVMGLFHFLTTARPALWEKGKT